MSRIKLTSSVELTEERRKLLTKTLSNNSIKFSKLLETKKGDIIVFCNDQKDDDAMFSDRCVQSLVTIDYKPVLPVDLQAKRSVLAHRLDTEVYSYSEQTIITEINDRNEWADVGEIFKIPRSSSIKIIFKTQDMAEKCLQTGILMFDLSLPSRDFSRDIFVDIKYCYKCYQMEDHLSVNCPNAADYIICSKCSSQEHTYQQCSSDLPKCLHCSGDHNTLANSCPVKRELIRKKRLTISAGVSYSGAVSGPRQSSAAPFMPSSSTVVNNDIVRNTTQSLMCLFVASLKNNEIPGTFQSTLNQLLESNNLPNFTMGNVDPPSVATLFSSASVPGGVSFGTGSSSRADDTTTSPTSKQEEPQIITNGSQRMKQADSITVYKRKGSDAPTSQNVKKLYNAGTIKIESKLGLAQDECLKIVSLMEADWFGEHTFELKAGEYDKRQPKKSDDCVKTRNGAAAKKQ